MFKRILFKISVTLATALTFVLPQAYAQDEDIEEVLVTGIRASLIKGLDIKRDNIQMVDAIVAEDIGKFPDNNVVEALQRVTGVQVTDRGGGEVSVVTIRGLNDVTTTVNGRNIFTTTGRSVALQDVPASLLRQVDVYKTRSADLIEHGIAGVIDIHTHRPFDFDGFKIAAAARVTEQEQVGKQDPNVSVLLSNTWDTGLGAVGALINISYAETNFRDQGLTAGAQVPFVTLTPNASGPYGPLERIFRDHGGVTENPIWVPGQEFGLPTAPGSTLTINGEEQEYYLGRDAVFQNDLTGERERPAWNISLQWAPDDSTTYFFEAFYNGFRQSTFNSLFFSFVDWWGSVDVNDPVEIYPGTNVIASRFINFPFNFNSGDYTNGKTDSFLYAIGEEKDIGDKLHIKTELVIQRSKFEEEFLALRTNRVPERMFVDFNTGGGLPSFTFLDAADNNANALLTDESLWNMDNLYDNGTRDKGDAFTLTLDADYDADWGIINNLKVGFRYDDRSASTWARTAAREGGNPCGGCVISDFPGLITTTTDFFDGRANTPTAWAIPDGSPGGGLVRNRDALRDAYNIDPRRLALRPTFDISEITTSLHGVVDFATEVFGNTLDGQFGLRYVSISTDMVFNSHTFPTPDGEPLNFTLPVESSVASASVSSSKLLPSFLVRYAFAEDWMARFSYGQTLRRPVFGDLNPQVNYIQSVTGADGSGNAGNPNLKPTESKNIDLSLEWYFSESSAVYGTYFRRDIDGLVIPFQVPVIYDVPDDDPDRGPELFIIDQPNNSSDGVLEGFELGTVWFPESFPTWLGWMDGFGLQASYTILDSEQKIPDSVYDVDTDRYILTGGTVTLPMFGVSDTSYSVVLAYENYGFDARLSYVWREDFVHRYEVPIFANPRRISRHPEESLNFQLSYNVTDNFIITFDATNLTDELQQEYYGDNSTIHNFSNVILSRTYALGTRISF